MPNENKKSIKPASWLYIFIILHVFVWTLAPVLVRFNLPMDAMEGTTWGHQLEWGYDKNPFLNGWLTELAVILGGPSGWMTYLFSQLSVGLCLLAVWKLGKKILPPLYALSAVLFLEALQYYNFHAIDFNDNTLELSLWVLTILFFYRAIRENNLVAWLLTAFSAGFCMMTKYFTVMLLLPMLLFLCFNQEARQQFKKPSLYLSIIIFLLIILPHTIWLFSHNFITLDYAFDRVGSVASWMNHLRYPSKFLWQQFETLFPALLLFSLLFIGKKSFLTKKELPISAFDREFLYYLGLGPLLATLLVSLLTGIKLRAGWGQPLLSLSGILAIIWLRPNITRERMQQFIIGVFSIMIIMACGYCTALVRANKPSSANFPGAIIAMTLTQEWLNLYHTPLTYVAGPRWLAGNIAFYSPFHPAVYMDWNKPSSPWIDETKLRHSGAIFVWDPTEAYQVEPAEVRARFVNLGPIQVMHFSWLRNKKMPPVEISVAFLPPEK